jgi:uncharacterized protein (TIGR03435 family)
MRFIGMNKIVLQAFLALIAFPGAAAQSSKAPTPSALSFDAASIKVNRSGDTRTSMRSLPGGRIEGTNRTLTLLIQNAFELQDFQIVGGPDWIGSARYDVSATANRDVTPTERGSMMRALLADRFKLAAHTERRDAPIYALRLARADGRLGPGLKKAADDARGGFREGDGSLTAQRTSTERLVRELTSYAGRPVVDETGLTGEWALTLTWAPDAAGGTDANLTSIFTAMREQLGLKLDATRGPVEVLVIDRAERPSED